MVVHTAIPGSIHCKKWEVDLIQENAISVALWVQAVKWTTSLALGHAWFWVTSPFQWSFLAKHELGCKQNLFCNCIVGIITYWCIIGWTPKIFMHWVVFTYFCVTIHSLFELWAHKGWNLFCGRCGKWYWPRSCNWGDPPWVKSTTSFFQCILWSG